MFEANRHPASFYGFHLTAVYKLDSLQTGVIRESLSLLLTAHLLYPQCTETYWGFHVH